MSPIYTLVSPTKGKLDSLCSNLQKDQRINELEQSIQEMELLEIHIKKENQTLKENNAQLRMTYDEVQSQLHLVKTMNKTLRRRVIALKRTKCITIRRSLRRNIGHA